MRRTASIAVWAALLGAASFAHAQAALPQTPPVFRAGVEIVRLDVHVTDAEGRPLRDLRQDEIEIVEDGGSRPVVLFQHIEEPAESYADTASHTVAGEVSTNQGAARGHLYVLVFDQLHLSPGNEQRARQAAQRFVRTQLRPGDRVALYALPGPGPQIGFTADARRVASELVKVRGMAEPQAFGVLGSMTLLEAFQIVRGNDQALRHVAERLQAQSGAADVLRRDNSAVLSNDDSALTNPIREDARRIADIADGESRRVLAMLSDILRPLRAVEGRKSVLFISEGFFGDRLSRDIETVAAAAAESYSVVYAFDVNRRQLDITAAEPTGADQSIAIHDRLSPLGSLAAETGGRLIIDAAQYADQAFAALAGQSQDYYLVGFHPRADALRDRGAYRPVTVRVHRNGAQVSTRTGFTLSGAAARTDRHQAIDRAMAAPFPQQGLPLQYTTYVLRGTTPAVARVILSLAADLPIASSAQNQPAEVVFVVRAAGDGHVAASGRDAMPLPQREAAASTTGTGTFHVQFDLPPGDYLMRAVVREPGGLIGSADRRFTVRALGGPAIESTDLILSSTRGELPVRPTTYVGDGLSGVLELYGRTADQLRDARVTVDLVPVGEATAIVSGSADLQEVRSLGDGASREARVDLPLPGVTPGTYVARARVAVGPDTVTEVLREVEIRRGERPAAAVAGEVTVDPRDIVTGAFARQYATALTEASSPAAAQALRGLDRLAARDYAAAIAALQTALQASENGGTAFLLGWAFHLAGDDRQAISAWRRAAFVDPTIVPAHLALADLYVRLSQPSLAVQALRAGLAALPQSPELLDRLSRLERP
jgi:VWFA-related protein